MGKERERKVTVDAVIVRGREILLVRRGKAPFRGFYALPGGYVDRKESLKDAVAREAKEETGLKVRPLRTTGIYDDPDRDSRGNVSVAFLCEPVGGKLKGGSDAEEAKFFRTDGLPEKIAFDHGRIISDALNALGKGTKRPGLKVLCGGTFNIIHPGHLFFLKSAGKLGDELIVVVAHDRTVKGNGKRLLFPAEVRADLVRSLGVAEKVLVGSEKDMMEIVKKEKPDVIAMGYDQDEGVIRRKLRLSGLNCRTVKIGQLKGYSTKKITGG